MRYVQSLPPVVRPAPDDGSVKAATAVNPTAAVSERTLPPLIFRPHQPPAPQPAINRRWLPRQGGIGADRRHYCRRVQQQNVLLELRSGHDRRRHCQRADDITTAIDEKI